MRKLRKPKEPCQSLARFRALFESNIVPVVFWHVDARIRDANDAYLKLVRYTREELVAGKLRCDVITPNEYAHLDEQAIKEIQAGRTLCAPYEKEYVRRDSTRVPVLITGALLPGKTDAGIALALDLTEFKKARARSDPGDALLNAAFTSLVGNVALIDKDGTILRVNDAWYQYGRENGAALESIGVGANYLAHCCTAYERGDRIAGEALCGIASVLEGTVPHYSMEYQSSSPAGARWFEMIVRPLRRREGGAIITHLETTARHLAEARAQNILHELYHVTRVATAAQLTASLAHELNQPLTSIHLNTRVAARLLQDHRPELSRLREILADMSTDEERARNVINRLHSLMQKGTPTFSRLGVNTLLRDATRMIAKGSFMNNVHMRLKFAPERAAIYGDQTQLHQVLLNLLVNACQAMAQADRPSHTLTVTAGTRDNTALISVSDTGPGIPAFELERIFEPFFTTKPEGIGMGLAICRSIVESHRGHIWAENNPAGGATFHVSLPLFSSETSQPSIQHAIA